jgi:hypothetical protein
MRHHLLPALLGLALIAGPAAAATQSQVVQARAYTMAPGDHVAAAAPEAPRAAAEGDVVDECPGNPGTGNAPANVSGAVGERWMVIVTTGTLGVYDVPDCRLISREPLRKIIATAFPVRASDELREARVIYDPRTRRFFLTVTLDSRDRKQVQFYGTSLTGIDWFLYEVVLSERGKQPFCKVNHDAFWTFPSAGKNDNRWFVTANQLDFETNVWSSAILDIDKAPTLTGDPAKVVCFNDLDTNLQPPIVLDDDPKAFFLSAGRQGGDQIRRYSIMTKGPIDRDAIDTGLSSVDVPEWRRPFDAQQPNGEALDASDGGFLAPSIQVGKRLFNAHTVRIGDFARVRLYKISAAGELVNEFTLPAADGEHNFIASFATASADNDAPGFLTFTRTIPGKPAQGRAAMMMAVGPNGKNAGWRSFVVQVSPGEFTKSSSGRTCNNHRDGGCDFGAWSSTQIDPGNPTRAWGFSELITTGTIGGAGSDLNWTTRAARVKAAP